jgi:hypothetical protein
MMSRMCGVDQRNLGNSNCVLDTATTYEGALGTHMSWTYDLVIWICGCPGFRPLGLTVKRE